MKAEKKEIKRSTKRSWRRRNKFIQRIILNLKQSVVRDPKENERREQETETALEVCREKLGEHPETAATLLFSGINAKRRKERSEAEQKLTEALELFKKLLGKHFMTAECLKAIADLYFFLGRGEAELDKCLAYYAEAIEMFEDLGMSGSKEIVLTLKNFGSYHMRKDNFSEAMSLLTKAERVAEARIRKGSQMESLDKDRIGLFA
ncbi:hypothetical protein OS493_038590 [Desmophyllum pertusum]|uniref:Tetratricopeptide repeat protein n=1 Tax=Desmophyllum pertusum TaxID=174260 RepID=A0A9W9YKK3_9CNID|nr:hypothetical protein OS493_038590 [Desmophyllum pertusum]